MAGFVGRNARALRRMTTPEEKPWPSCPVCGEPASSARAQRQTHRPGGMERPYDRSGVVTWECTRHSERVYMNEKGERVSSPPPDITIVHQ